MGAVGPVAAAIAHDDGPIAILQGINRRGPHTTACGAAHDNDRVALVVFQPGVEISAEKAAGVLL